jgi:hypothetical protein
MADSGSVREATLAKQTTITSGGIAELACSVLVATR